jgi:uncharacterized protein YwbE
MIKKVGYKHFNLKIGSNVLVLLINHIKSGKKAGNIIYYVLTLSISHMHIIHVRIGDSQV